MHSYGKSYRDIVRGLHGQYDNPTDYVAFPETEDQILALVHFCEDNRVSLTPSGAGPSQERMWLGSEGTLGVITEAWIRLHARPRIDSSATVKFEVFMDGLNAVRELSQSKLYPVNCRLVSRMEAVAMGLGDGKHGMLILGFESEHYFQHNSMYGALDICKKHNGWYKRRKIRHTEQTIREGSIGKWRNNFIKTSYIRDVVARKGLISETFETAVTWDQFEKFHACIVAVAQNAFDTHCRGRGLLTVRFTHIYPDGPAPYYTVIAWTESGKQIETWDAIKVAVSDALIANGGTITHHHAVGRDHRPWYEKERGELFGTVLSGLKDTLDPKWVLNPGVLLKEK